MVLLLVANGLRKRLDAAYHMAIVALGVGIVGSLLKGVDYEEAMALGVVLCALVPARRHFYRRSSLLAEPLSSDWIGAIALALAGTFALGVFAYKHVDYTADLWWRFAAVADAPRFLRAMVGASAVTLAFAVGRLMRPPVPAPAVLSLVDRARAREVTRRARESNGHLALVGDKSLLFSDSGQSFVMYREHGGTLVALGDPIGLETEAAELLWAFKEMGDRRGSRVAFYEVGRHHLPLYIDLGMTLRKLGEEARVPLTSFTVEGNARRPLRRGLREAEKSGA
ncbi:MAG: phosphatidylglycerol lysyltransferase domain-containing protein, partial [Gemmatimonadaceae bacterium]